MACTERWEQIYNCPNYQTGRQLVRVCDGRATVIRSEPCHYPQSTTCNGGMGPYGPSTYGPAGSGPCPPPNCPPFLSTC